jgi:hypothetical protein
MMGPTAGVLDSTLQRSSLMAEAQDPPNEGEATPPTPQPPEKAAAKKTPAKKAPAKKAAPAAKKAPAKKTAAPKKKGK